LLGGIPSDKTATALYLADGNTPLAICGNSFIQGTAFLPRAGVKRGRIAGQYYQGKKLIYGLKKQSKIQLPAFSKEKIAALKKLTTLQKNQVLIEDSLVQSFRHPLQVLRAPQFILGKQVLKGHILLIAEKAIEVGPKTQIENVILMAPQITFKSGFSGQLQAIAFDSLLIEQDCHFSYPSSLGVFQQKQKSTPAYLQLDSLSTVKGFVWMKALASSRQKGKAHLAASTIVEGEVFIDAYLDFKGKVYGQVSTKKFSLRTAASVYENHLLDVTIDRSKRHKAYLSPTIWASNPLKGIVLWLE